MTFEEAKKLAQDTGVKIRNQYFTPDEFFHYVDGVLVCEMGYNMAGWYSGEDWQDIGWSVHEV